MIDIVLDGSLMIDKENAHNYIREKLKVAQYTGSNLDALWDVLSVCDLNLNITIINHNEIIKLLGEYGESLLETFLDAAIENSKIKVNIGEVLSF